MLSHSYQHVTLVFSKILYFCMWPHINQCLYDVYVKFQARRAMSVLKREEAIQQRSEKRMQQKKLEEQRKLAAKQREEEERLVLRQRLAVMRQEEAAKREQENAQRLLNRMAMLQAEEERRMVIQLAVLRTNYHLHLQQITRSKIKLEISVHFELHYHILNLSDQPINGYSVNYISS